MHTYNKTVKTGKAKILKTGNFKIGGNITWSADITQMCRIENNSEWSLKWKT